MLAILAALSFSPVSLMVSSLGSAEFAYATVVTSHFSHTPHVEQDGGQDHGRVLSDVFDLLDDKYIHDLGSDKLFLSGLKALLEGLDPHTQYFNPEEAKQFRTNLEDKFGGIGVTLGIAPSNYPVVMARFLNAPAARAGVQKGDLIVGVDGQSTHAWASPQVSGKLMGRVGTTVNLTVRRPGNEKDRTVSIRRATIHLSSIRGLDPTEKGFWLDEEARIGYIRISRFAEDTVPGFRSAYARLKKQGMRALVIDLRSNFGGLLRAAVDTADIFVDSGLIVRSVGRDGKEEKWMARKGEDMALPLAVLVDQDTASASEVLSACLQDHKRALMVGERSFGKGSVQRLFKVGKSGAMVKMTTALYYPASGRNIDKLSKPEGSDVWGVSPDPGLEVKLDKAEREAWLKSFFAMDDQVGTDEELPPYESSADKVLVAARDALRKSMTGQAPAP